MLCHFPIHACEIKSTPKLILPSLCSRRSVVGIFSPLYLFIKVPLSLMQCVYPIACVDNGFDPPFVLSTWSPPFPSAMVLYDSFWWPSGRWYPPIRPLCTSPPWFGSLTVLGVLLPQLQPLWPHMTCSGPSFHGNPFLSEFQV